MLHAAPQKTPRLDETGREASNKTATHLWPLRRSSAREPALASQMASHRERRCGRSYIHRVTDQTDRQSGSLLGGSLRASKIHPMIMLLHLSHSGEGWSVVASGAPASTEVAADGSRAPGTPAAVAAVGAVVGAGAAVGAAVAPGAGAGAGRAKRTGASGPLSSPAMEPPATAPAGRNKSCRMSLYAFHTSDCSRTCDTWMRKG